MTDYDSNPPKLAKEPAYTKARDFRAWAKAKGLLCDAAAFDDETHRFHCPNGRHVHWEINAAVASTRWTCPLVSDTERAGTPVTESDFDAAIASAIG